MEMHALSKTRRPKPAIALPSSQCPTSYQNLTPSTRWSRNPSLVDPVLQSRRMPNRSAPLVVLSSPLLDASSPSSDLVVRAPHWAPLALPEAVEALEREAPWAPAHAVPVSDDVGAKMAAAEVLVVEEGHRSCVCLCSFCGFDGCC